mmetsp:Transcript_74377/g.210074  ORF Transcript_74377/g.210074 Transcript_74377/m.210074 type:complete len:213 (+) Transcript_74377:167-805(+)
MGQRQIARAVAKIVGSHRHRLREKARSHLVNRRRRGSSVHGLAEHGVSSKCLLLMWTSRGCVLLSTGSHVSHVIAQWRTSSAPSLDTLVTPSRLHVPMVRTLCAASAWRRARAPARLWWLWWDTGGHRGPCARAGTATTPGCREGRGPRRWRRGRGGPRAGASRSRARAAAGARRGGDAPTWRRRPRSRSSRRACPCGPSSGPRPERARRRR